MMLGVIFVGLPVLVFLGLAALRPGAPLWAGALVALAGLGLFWLARVLVLPPLFTGENATDGLTTAALGVLSVAVVLGLAAQGLRALLPQRRPGWVYPAIVLATAAAAGLPFASLLGM
jgi:hypothetical protein